VRPWEWWRLGYLVVLSLPLFIWALKVLDLFVVEDPQARGDFIDQVVVVCDQ
jgi:hypothetical protein